MIESGEPGQVEALRAGDDAAYERLVREESGRMLAVARRLLRDEEEARDVVQEAFISAFRAMSRFEGQSKLSTWLHRITVNAALMRLRSRQRQATESIEDLLPEFGSDGHPLAECHAWLENSERQAARHERAALVRAAIDRLPESYRTVLMLRDIEELDTAETAKLLGTNDNAVKVRLHRARQALRTLLAEQFSQGAL